jgi:hypothetical protein
VFIVLLLEATAGLLVAAVQVSVDALKKGGRVDDRASVSAWGLLLA